MADLIDSFDLPDIILQTPDKFNKPEVIFPLVFHSQE